MTAPVTEQDQQYLQQIRAIPRLTREEELELAKRCAAGDRDAIRKMVSANLGLVVAVAMKYADRDVPLMDLIQEGSFGLMKAAEKFDYTRDIKFSTYADDWIRKYILSCVLDSGSLISVKGHTAAQIRKVLSAKTALSQELEREPSLEEVAEASGFTPAEVTKYLSLIPNVCSLDAPAGEDGNATLQQILEDPQPNQSLEVLVHREMEQTVNALMNQLPQRERLILRLRFGIEDGTCHTLDAVGKQLDISGQRVRQLEQKALKKLRQLGVKFGLEDFLD